MASSRTPRTKPDRRDEPLVTAVQSAVASAFDALHLKEQRSAELLRRASPRRRDQPLVLALSGGRDSMALLDIAARLATRRGAELRGLHAVHVHHGISRNADEWLMHCERECAARGVPLTVKRVEVRPRGRGLEAAARDQRYAALADSAREIGARIVLTAHHRDDRLETFLLQWMRGAGVDGLAAFPPRRSFDEDLLLVRPLIDVARADVDDYVARHAVTYIEDDSNDDRALLRNAVRSEILPRLDALRPGFRSAAARSVELVAEAADSLQSVSQADLTVCAEGAPDGMLWLDRVLSLPAARAAGVLRAWLASAGLLAPTRARLGELIRQARTARSDARLLVRVGDQEVRRYRGLLLLRPAQPIDREAQSFRWAGEPAVALTAWGGTLHFAEVEGEGFEPEWLRSEPLEIRPRGGGERFKPNAHRPSKTLKRLFQDAGIAEFERGRLPLVWRGGDLVFVAGLGADVRFTSRNGTRIVIAWQPDARLIDGAARTIDGDGSL